MPVVLSANALAGWMKTLADTLDIKKLPRHLSNRFYLLPGNF